MSDDRSLSWGVYDTVSNAFFSVSQKANISLLHSMLRHQETTFQKGDRFLYDREIRAAADSAIVSTSSARFYKTLYHQVTLTLPLGIICSLLFCWCGRVHTVNSIRLADFCTGR